MHGVLGHIGSLTFWFRGLDGGVWEKSCIEARRAESGGGFLEKGHPAPTPMGSGAQPQPKLNLVHFIRKMWHLVTAKDL